MSDLMPNTLPYDVCRMMVDDCKELDPTFRERILGWIRSRALEKLCDVVSSSSGLTGVASEVDERRFLMQIEALFKKNAYFSDNLKCTEAAVQSFHTNEAACSTTNIRLLLHPKPEAEKLLDRMARDIEVLFERLGGFTGFLNELPEAMRITSGATRGAPKRESSPPAKVKRSVECSSEAVPYLAALRKFWGYSKAPSFTEVEVNRVAVVPKNWKTHRTIACEAEGNLSLQLAFDTWCKKALLKWGINLSSQDANQRLAEKGSILDHLSTIDLSAASDSLSIGLVWRLLPFEFARYLNAVRATHYEGGDTFGSGEYAKFSSMGNGATFVLETLIFTAACRSLKPYVYSVYGDDIIIDKPKAKQLMELLDYMGFQPNKEKSYLEGPFRESCGGNYVNGIDVTPFYLRWQPRSYAEVSHIINGLAAVAVPGGVLWKYLLGVVKEHRLLVVPHCESTTAGVWVHPSVAYKLDLMSNVATSKSGRLRRQTATGIVGFKAYVATPRKSGGHKERVIHHPDGNTELVDARTGDTRHYFLWHLGAQRGSCERSRVSIYRLLRDRKTRAGEIRRIAVTGGEVPTNDPNDRLHYERRLVVYRPSGQSLSHLVWWSDDLARLQ